MSELNVYHHELRHNEYDEFYLKYEVDKVIAELEESHKKEVEQLLMEIVELKAKLGAVNELVKESRELLKESQRMHQRCADNASKQIRRLKRALYKACVNWAHFAVAFFSSYATKDKWYRMEHKCHKRWLELAEVFK